MLTRLKLLKIKREMLLKRGALKTREKAARNLKLNTVIPQR